MALSTNTVWEVRTTGSNTNGGGFVTGASGTDWSQQDAAQYSVTDGVTNGTTTITSATANFGTDVVGNIIYVQGGTGSVTAGWYQIVSRTNSTTIVVDRSTGLTTGTGVTLKIGGAFASLAPFSPSVVLVDGNTVWVKAGTYNHASTLTVGLGGSTTSLVAICGYGTTRGDQGRPLISSTSTGVALNVAGAGVLAMDLEVDGNDSATSGIVASSNGGRGAKVIRCKVSRCTLYGFSGFSLYWACEVTDLAAGGRAGIVLDGPGPAAWYCYVHDTPGYGFLGSWSSHATVDAYFCVADACTSGFLVSNSGGDLYGCRIVGCVAYGNTSQGFITGNNFNIYPWILNCISYGNGGYGFSGTNGFNATLLKELVRNNAAGNNTSGNYQGGDTYKADSSVTLTADPFVDADNGDFRLNLAAGGGALLRGVGFPGAFPGGLTTGYLDIGAAQHYEPTDAEVAAAVWAYPDRTTTA